MQAGYYNNTPIPFGVELYWQNDFPYIVLVVTSEEAGLPDLDRALTVDVLSSDLQAHRLVPFGPDAPRKLKGALTAEQTCKLRSDPTLEIMIEPRSGSGVWGQTATLNLAGFHDLSLLVEAACRSQK